MVLAACALARCPEVDSEPAGASVVRAGVLAFVSADRRSALVHARDGSWMVLKVHGAQVATRRLKTLELRPRDDGVTVATGERMFADVSLRLPPEARDKLLTMV